MAPSQGLNFYIVIYREMLMKSSSHEPCTGWNTLIVTIEHPLGKEIQGCSNKVPRVMYGPTPGA